ncbi:MAG TPA: hypothetical protein PKH31_01040 [Candidatus Sumerlaeota bacterium]|nr:hypothetical protein [Candidatus Sumerlaeota bacterium]
MIKRIFVFLLGIALLMGLGGCASLSDRYIESSWHKSTESFIRHPCPLVKYPTYVGMAPGVATMVPIWLTGCLTIGIQEICDSERKNMIPVDESWFFPSLIPLDAGANLFGATSWALFGWWWPEDDYMILKPEPPEERQEEKKPE